MEKKARQPKRKREAETGAKGAGQSPNQRRAASPEAGSNGWQQVQETPKKVSPAQKRWHRWAKVPCSAQPTQPAQPSQPSQPHPNWVESPGWGDGIWLEQQRMNQEAWINKQRILAHWRAQATPWHPPAVGSGWVIYPGQLPLQESVHITCLFHSWLPLLFWQVGHSSQHPKTMAKDCIFA